MVLEKDGEAQGSERSLGGFKGLHLAHVKPGPGPQGHRAEVPWGGATLCSREPRAQHLGFHAFQA